MESTAEIRDREDRPLRALARASLDVSEEPLSKKWLEFRKVLERHRGEKMLMILTGYPDPDNIASGLAHKFLAKMLDIDTTLLCFHEVSHQENRALVKRLELDLQLYNEKFDLESYSAYAVVDTQKSDTPIADKLSAKTLLSFVDHHKRLGDSSAEFVDIREDAASTAAIYTEYLRAYCPQGLNPGETDQVRLATALMHGIRSDNMALLEASRLEFEAAAYIWS
jgi:nanoRNase/pAp phosphatase (c-di-AMP/oligoRNAs hydrolase)